MLFKPAGLAAVLVLVAGCGGPHAPATAAPAPVTASASAWVAPPEPSYSTTPVISKPAFRSLRGVSRGSAETAVKTLIGYVRADSYAPRRLLPKTDYTAADFAEPVTHMTPEMGKWWLEQVADKYQTEKNGQVRVVAFFHVTGTDNNAFAAKGPLVVNERISKVTASGAGDGDLDVQLTYRADLRMIDTIDIGRPILMPITKTVTYTLVRSAGTWLIDGIDGSYQLGK